MFFLKSSVSGRQSGRQRMKYFSISTTASVAVELVVQPAVLLVVPGPRASLACLVDLVGHEPALRAGQGNEAALAVACTQVVVIASRCVRGRPQKRAVLGLRSSLAQIGVVLPADHVVHVRTRAVAALPGGPGKTLMGRRRRALLSPAGRNVRVG